MHAQYSVIRQGVLERKASLQPQLNLMILMYLRDSFTTLNG